METKESKKTNKGWKVAAIVAAVLSVGGFAYWKYSQAKAFVENIRVMLTGFDIDFAKVFNGNVKANVRIAIDNNSDLPITINNIVATIYKVENGEDSQLGSNAPMQNISIPAQQRTPVEISIDIPTFHFASSVLSTAWSALVNKTAEKKKYKVVSSVVVKNQTVKTEQIFNV